MTRIVKALSPSGFFGLLVWVMLQGLSLGFLLSPVIPLLETAIANAQPQPPPKPIYRGTDAVDKERITRMEERGQYALARVDALSVGFADINARLIRMETQTDINGRILWAVLMAIAGQILAALWGRLGGKREPRIVRPGAE